MKSGEIKNKKTLNAKEVYFGENPMITYFPNKLKANKWLCTKK